jgi:putative ABC transport system permease protein
MARHAADVAGRDPRQQAAVLAHAAGIALGVASIIGVMTGISVIQTTMERELSVLGAETFQLQKWPAGGFSSPEERRKAMKRPPVTVEEALAIRRQATLARSVGIEYWQGGRTVRYRGDATEGSTTVLGADPQYSDNNAHFIDIGRNLSEVDMRSASRVAVIGAALAERFFPYEDPIGRDIQVDGRKFRVIGVFVEKKSAFDAGFDGQVVIPYTTFLQVYGNQTQDGFERSVGVTVRAPSPALVDEAIEETRQIMRRIRKLSPRDEDDFVIFSSDSQIENFNRATQGVKVGAFVLGIIALVVAGIGIMNIMLVSVTERTKEIGIRMSIGARRSSILRQFLFEAIILCNLGGLIGIALGLGLGNLIAMFASFEVAIPLEWAAIGVLFCSTVGVVFGLMPAVKASRLDPIEALRYE